MNLRKMLHIIFGHGDRKIICLIFLCFPCFAYPLHAQMPVVYGVVLGISKTFFFTASTALIVISLLIVYFLFLKKHNIWTLKKRNNPTAIKFAFQDEKTIQNSHFYHTLMQSTKDGIVYYDRQKNIKYANPAFFSITGLNNESFTIDDFQAKLHFEHTDFFIKRDEALNEEGFYERNITFKGSDGDNLTLSTHSVVVKTESGEEVGSLIVFRDITSINREMKEMLKSNLESEAENKLKAGFLAVISHEIRTPLNGVVGFANLLLEDNLSKEDKQKYVEHINYNSDKLLQIISDIIDLSRLSSSQSELTYEEALLSEIVKNVEKDAKFVIKRTDKPIILNIRNNFGEANDMILTDRVWLKRVLNHLLDNAIKFTLNGSIDFIYSLEKGMIRFTVKDTGIGINKENLSRIFEEFKQEFSGHHRPFEGLGVGLTLAKEVVGKMGGKITVKSEKEIGSEFTFYIPYRPVEVKPHFTTMTVVKNDSPKTINWRNKKCLLVDDNKDILLYLKRILIDTGITILTARTGIEAVEFVKSDPAIDIVLLDIQMPQMNGIEATKEIKKLRHNLPVIAQTAFAYEDDIDLILATGCDACLIKPIRREHLMTVMSGFMKSN